MIEHAMHSSPSRKIRIIIKKRLNYFYVSQNPYLDRIINNIIIPMQKKNGGDNVMIVSYFPHNNDALKIREIEDSLIELQKKTNSIVNNY